MDRREYDHLQERINDLMKKERLSYKGVYGKRKEGYAEAILAVKSLLSREFKPAEGD